MWNWPGERNGALVNKDYNTLSWKASDLCYVMVELFDEIVACFTWNAGNGLRLYY